MAKSNGTRYPALRTIAAWYKAFGYLVGGILALSGVISLVKSDGFAVGIGLVVGGVAFAILSIAVAEIIAVFLDTESSTRSSAESLQKLVELQSAPPKPPAPAAQRPAPKPTPPPRKATASQEESIRKLIRNLSADGRSPDQIAFELRKEGMPTLGSSTWTTEAVEAALAGS
ncbi:recombinase family protein [Marinobacter sp. CA1]|uniref:recombinase family protein n=1 Tax=Marinobacter sp. CA1 TaxID=2817656 RepID=UPI001D076B82|nr:recombinase family protein [Marinobacter sp. CA1]UDL03986.1 hypothetical protein J2887_14855 [Marinobacter sp. CA1]